MLFSCPRSVAPSLPSPPRLRIVPHAGGAHYCFAEERAASFVGPNNDTPLSVHLLSIVVKSHHPRTFCLSLFSRLRNPICLHQPSPPPPSTSIPFPLLPPPPVFLVSRFSKTIPPPPLRYFSPSRTLPFHAAFTLLSTQKGPSFFTVRFPLYVDYNVCFFTSFIIPLPAHLNLRVYIPNLEE